MHEQGNNNNKKKKMFWVFKCYQLHLTGEKFI